MTLEEITAKLAEIEKRLEPTFKWSYTRIELYRDGSGKITVSPHQERVELASFSNLVEIPKALNKALNVPIEKIVQWVAYYDNEQKEG